VKIYCDTDTLFSNIKRHEHQAKEQVELDALEKLFAFHRAGKVVLLRSLGNLRELEKTEDVPQRQRLRADYENLPALPKDERFYGVESLITDPYYGNVYNPLVSDVQDEAMLLELKNRGLKQGDAQLITQAVCNDCDIFITVMRAALSNHIALGLKHAFLLFGCVYLQRHWQKCKNALARSREWQKRDPFAIR
jgi:hypothetical protein